MIIIVSLCTRVSRDNPRVRICSYVTLSKLTIDHRALVTLEREHSERKNAANAAGFMALFTARCINYPAPDFDALKFG